MTQFDLLLNSWGSEVKKLQVLCLYRVSGVSSLSSTSIISCVSLKTIN